VECAFKWHLCLLMPILNNPFVGYFGQHAAKCAVQMRIVVKKTDSLITVS